MTTRSGEKQLRRFWHAYLKDADVQTVIVYTRNLFYHNREKRCFIRQLDTNDFNVDLSEKLNLGGAFPGPCNPNSRHYVAAGDSRCVLTLTRFLEQNGIRTEAFASYDTTAWHSTGPRRNLILLGNKRTFKNLDKDFLLEKAWDFDFQIEDKYIRDRTKPEGSPYEDDRNSVHGIVSRAYDKQHGTNITILAGNSGCFFEGVGQFLVTEHRILELNERLKAEDKPLPPFEVLLRVTVEEHDMVPGAAYVHLVDGPRVHPANERCMEEQWLANEEARVCISFKSKDRDEVKSFRDRLKEHDIESWWSEDIPKDCSDWPQALQKRFDRACVVLALKGKEGFGETQLVELGYALALQKCGRPVEIFPVVLESVPEGESGFPDLLKLMQWTDLRKNTGQLTDLVTKLKQSLGPR